MRPHVDFFFENWPRNRNFCATYKIWRIFEILFFAVTRSFFKTLRCSFFASIPNFIVEKYSEIKLGVIGDEEVNHFC